jgi:hypothetical protein
MYCNSSVTGESRVGASSLPARGLPVNSTLGEGEALLSDTYADVYLTVCPHARYSMSCACKGGKSWACAVVRHDAAALAACGGGPPCHAIVPAVRAPAAGLILSLLTAPAGSLNEKHL